MATRRIETQCGATVVVEEIGTGTLTGMFEDQEQNGNERLIWTSLGRLRNPEDTNDPATAAKGAFDLSVTQSQKTLK